MTTDSPGAGYVLVGSHEAIAPAAPGSYGFPAARRELMLLIGPLMVAASAWMLWRGLSGDGRWFWLPVGAVGVLFFGYATLAWAVQRLIVTPAGLRSRLPMPGQTRMDFSDVAAIVVFPRVQSAAPVASHAVLVRRDGRPGFRLAAPPHDPSLLEGVVALAQRASGAPTYWCTSAVSDTDVAWRLRFPQLTGAPGASDPSAWRPPLPLLEAGT